MVDRDSILIDSFAVSGAALDAAEQAHRTALAAQESIAVVIRPVRKRIGWSQARLAEYVAVPINQVIKIERGDLLPRLDDLPVWVRWIRGHAPVQEELPFPIADDADA